MGDTPEGTQRRRNSMVVRSGVRDGAAARPHLLEKAGSGVVFDIPLVHAGQHVLGLGDDEIGPVRENVEIRIGHDRRDLDDMMKIRSKTRHLEVNPYQFGRILHHPCAASFGHGAF